MNKEKNFVSAVVYIHNSEKKIENFLQMLMNVLQDNFEHSEIICVNDFSEDNSMEIIRKTGSKSPITITVVNMSYFHGLELSMTAGVDISIGDYVFEFDSISQQYDPSLIMNVYRRSMQGYDIVSTSPDQKGKFTSKLFYKIFDYYSEIPYRMTTESFRILSRRVINRIGSMNRGIVYRKAAYANCGLKTDIIKYDTDSCNDYKFDRKEKRFRRKLAVDALILFTDIGYSFSKMMTVFMMVISFFMVIYSVAVYLALKPVAGWTTTILFLSVAFFGLFGILTAVIKYLQLIIELLFKRKKYSFEGIEKISG